MRLIARFVSPLHHQRLYEIRSHRFYQNSTLLRFHQLICLLFLSIYSELDSKKVCDDEQKVNSFLSKISQEYYENFFLVESFFSDENLIA